MYFGRSRQCRPIWQCALYGLAAPGAGGCDARRAGQVWACAWFWVASRQTGGQEDSAGRGGAAAALGISFGCFFHVAGAAIGLSALLMASSTAFSILKLVGAAYLVVTGLQMLWSRPALAAARWPNSHPWKLGTACGTRGSRERLTRAPFDRNQPRFTLKAWPNAPPVNIWPGQRPTCARFPSGDQSGLPVR